jgi:integrase
MVRNRYVELKDAKSVSYVNKAFRNLRAMLNFAGVFPNPVAVLSAQKVMVPNPTRDRFLTGKEIATLFDTYNNSRPEACRVALFCIMTGVRHSEVLGLRWKT